MKDRDITPEKRNEWMRKHLKELEKPGGLLKDLVEAIVGPDDGRVTYLAKKIAKIIDAPAKEIEKLRSQITSLKEELKRKPEMARYPLTPSLNYTEGETLENLKFKDIIKVIFRLIFGRIKKIKIISYR